MWVTGIDENGLGPRLGPLVVTAASLDLEAYDLRELADLGRDLGIDDSKVTSAFGRMGHAEGIALALAELCLGRHPEHIDDVLDAFVRGGAAALRRPCPKGASEAQCWSARVPLAAFGGDIEWGRDVLARLREAGAEVRHVRSVVACAGTLNHAFAAGQSKLRVDLAYFESLLRDARAAAPEDLLAICGMVGGIRKYRDHFSEFLDGVETLRESRREARYRIAGVGEVSFEVKADSRHLPVAMASMVGKYLRELMMARMNGFYREADPSFPAFSGYHDPITSRFVEASAGMRRKLKILPACFERSR